MSTFSFILREFSILTIKMALEALMKGIRTVAADKAWDMKPFEHTYAKILEAAYKNEWVYAKHLGELKWVDEKKSSLLIKTRIKNG